MSSLAPEHRWRSLAGITTDIQHFQSSGHPVWAITMSIVLALTCVAYSSTAVLGHQTDTRTISEPQGGAMYFGGGGRGAGPGHVLLSW